MDPELQDALDRMAADIRSGDAETRTYIDERFVEMRRHFDVIGESLRGDIRRLAELVAISNERTDGRIDEQTTRIEGVEGRVLGLEVRVTRLEGGQGPPRRPRRRG